MPLQDHFHPPLHGPRRWEGFHHAWATMIARQLNLETLPSEYYAESEITIGPELEVDVATMELPGINGRDIGVVATWTPPKPRFSASVEFSHLEGCEIRVYKDLGGGWKLCA